jgi:hypothetical protein
MDRTFDNALGGACLPLFEQGLLLTVHKIYDRNYEMLRNEKNGWPHWNEIFKNPIPHARMRVPEVRYRIFLLTLGLLNSGWASHRHSKGIYKVS